RANPERQRQYRHYRKSRRLHQRSQPIPQILQQCLHGSPRPDNRSRRSERSFANSMNLGQLKGLRNYWKKGIVRSWHKLFDTGRLLYFVTVTKLHAARNAFCTAAFFAVFNITLVAPFSPHLPFTGANVFGSFSTNISCSPVVSFTIACALSGYPSVAKIFFPTRKSG